MPREPPVTSAMWPFRSGLMVMIEFPPPGKSAPVQRRQPFGLGDVVHGVGVEERIELRRPAIPRSRAGSARSSGRSCGCLPRPARGEALRATPRSTIRSPDATGRRRPPPRAAHSSAVRAACRRATRSRGRNGQSAAALSTHATPGRLAAAQSSAARMPASGPGKSATPSGMTGRPKLANRAGSPLALRIRPSHCGASRAITRSRMVRPPIWRIGLSPPPIRRARPPASSTPGVAGIQSSRSPPLRL